ncbi:MAG: DUF4097 family beta strand repeat-containing protein [Flavobacteriaceae bacterium]|nr:DUF4097 family beta strand repeat-containing protein [Flavobacteriaceae bacterium]
MSTTFKITLLAVLFGTVIYAQKDYTQSLNGIEWVKIESKADLIVKTHNSNELLIKSGPSYKTPSRAKGLKLVGQGGTDNTDIGFYVIKEGNTLLVKNLRRSESGRIYLPASQNISVITTWHGDIDINGFKGEVEASAKLNGGIVINDVSGPLTANTLNGGIDVVFTNVSQQSPITVYSTNGALDISLPERTPADVTLGTINGEIYTNFDLRLPDKDGLRAIASKKVRGAINDGGVNIQLKTTNGNIYLRKK